MQNPKTSDKPEDQAKCPFFIRNYGFSGQITASAFEPRFGLIAIGTADGKLSIFNLNGRYISSRNVSTIPICQILPCTNTSSFLSINSPYLFEHHPFRHLNVKNSKEVQLSQCTPPTGSTFVHWTIIDNDICCRRTTFDFDVCSIEISPIHPEYAIIGLINGSIYGLSIEDLKITQLYLNTFEGSPLYGISWDHDFTFIFASQKMQKLDISELIIESYSNEAVKSLDHTNGYDACICSTKDGEFANLLHNGRISASIKAPPETKPVFAAIISKAMWVAVFHHPNGDKVFFNGQLFAELDHEYISPGIIVQHSLGWEVERSSPVFANLVTTSQRFLQIFPNKKFFSFSVPYIDGFAVYGSFMNFSLIAQIQQPGEIKPKRSILGFFSTKSRKMLEVPKPEPQIVNPSPLPVHIFEQGLYKLTIQITQHPLAGVENQWLCYREIPGEHQAAWELYQMCPIDGKENPLFTTLSKPLYGALALNHLHVLLADRTVLYFNIEKMEWPVVQICTLPPDASVCLYNPLVNKLFVGAGSHLKVYDEFIPGSQLQKKPTTVIDFGSDIIGIEMGYWVICKKMVFALDNELKIESRFDTSKNGKNRSFTFINSRSLIVKSKRSITLIGKKSGIKWTMNLEENIEAHLVPRAGMIVNNGKILTIYHLFSEPDLFDIHAPPVTVKRGLLCLFKKGLPEVNDTDKAFQYKRINRCLSETTEIMQQNLVKAHERGEQLSELEIKAEQMLSAAKQFHQIASNLKKH